MKRFFVLILALALVLCQGCSPQSEEQKNRINVVCTVFPQYDFVKNIGKDKVNVTLLLPPGSEAHSYEPSPKDIITLSDADLFVAIGGESEHWALHLMESEDLKDIPTLKLMDKTVKYTTEQKEGMEEAHDHKHGHIHDENCEHHEEEYDEHIWTSPQNAIVMVEEICQSLCAIDSKNQDFYKANAKAYIAKLTKLKKDFEAVRSNAKRDTLVFGDRFPLRYLTEEFDLNYYAAFPGCSSKTEPSVDTIVFLTEKIKEENIPVIFYMDYSDGRIARAIADECEIKAAKLYSCHNLSKNDFKSDKSYVSLMYENLSAIEEAIC